MGMQSTMPQSSIMPQSFTMPQLSTMPQPTTSPTMVMSNLSITAQFKMLLRLLKSVPLLSKLSAILLKLPSRSSSTENSVTQSPALSALKALRRLTMKSVPTPTSRRLNPPLPRLSKLHSRRSVTPRWSPSASQPQDTDITATDTTTARRLPKRLATMSLLSPLLSPLLRLPILSPSRPVSTSLSLSQESAVRTSLKRNASLSQKLRTLLRALRSASLSSLPLLARLLNLLSPSRFARKSTTDMLRIPMRLSQSPMLLPLLLMLKMVIFPPKSHYLLQQIIYS